MGWTALWSERFHMATRNLPTTALEESTGNMDVVVEIRRICTKKAWEGPFWAANLGVCSPGGGMADTEDSKSFALTGVRVQIPLRAQTSQLSQASHPLTIWL